MGNFENNPVIQMLISGEPTQLILFDNLAEIIGNNCDISFHESLAYLLKTTATGLHDEGIGLADTLNMPELWCYLSFKWIFKSMAHQYNIPKLMNKILHDQLIEEYHNWKDNYYNQLISINNEFSNIKEIFIEA